MTLFNYQIEGNGNMTAEMQARSLGYTRAVFISGGMEEGDFLVKPDTDFDSRFKAWACDWDEWIYVIGYNCLIEDSED